METKIPIHKKVIHHFHKHKEKVINHFKKHHKKYTIGLSIFSGGMLLKTLGLFTIIFGMAQVGQNNTSADYMDIFYYKALNSIFQYEIGSDFNERIEIINNGLKNRNNLQKYTIFMGKIINKDRLQ